MLDKLNSLLFKRTSTFFLTVMVSAFFFERAVDVGSEALFDKINEGKLWKHMKAKYEK